MNNNIRASSVSPSLAADNNIRSAKPPPPVRPKPKRTVTAPILLNITSAINIDDDQIKNSTTSDIKTGSINVQLPARGKVKALTERFETTTGSQQTSPDSIPRDIITVVKKESRLQRISAVGGCHSTPLLRFPKPQPPAPRYHGRNNTSSLNETVVNEAIERRNDINVSTLRHEKGEPVESRPNEGHRHRKENGESFLANSRQSYVVKVKRSRSCESAEKNNIDGVKKCSIRRNSIDRSDLKMEKASKKMAKKTPPPAVPPKPAKKSSLVPTPVHEYAEYDALPSRSPLSIFAPASKKADEKNRRSLPAFGGANKIEDCDADSVTPSQLEYPGRLSLGTPSSVTPTLATMELLNDSQLNISGHIYCAVRQGEVVEESVDFTAATTDSTERNRRDSDSESEDEPSFSAAVFGAIEIATGNRIAADGTRYVEEDAMTNYEEILEDLPITTPDNDMEDSEAMALSSSLKVETTGAGTIDQNNKWETCSSLTSTSGDSGSSAHAPMLISFRRRSSTDRKEEVSTSIVATAPDDPILLDDPTPTATSNSYCINQPKEEKRVRDTKSAPRTGGRLSRQSRPKSQLDMAANSLWRIKSDIQLNLSQAMGKIRLKVSSGTASSSNCGDQSPHSARSNIGSNAERVAKKDQKTRSTFYLPANGTDSVSPMTSTATHPTSISITLEAGLGDDLVSSTAASSSEDDDDDEFEAEWISTFNSDQTLRNEESEETTPTACGSGAAPNLPDIVPQDTRKTAEPVGKSHLLDTYRDEDMATTESSSPTTTTTEGTVSNSSIAPAAQGQKRNPLISESSCSSTVASGIGELERFELVYNSRFAFSEPLYQHYRSQTASVQRHQTFSEGDGKGTLSRRDQLLSSSQLGSQRTLWCELPEVQGGGLLQRMNHDERKLQEAMFEVITSEASYLRSLNILITQFMASPQLSGNTALGSCITKQERKQLFSNILSVRDCSERLLCALESRLEENVVLADVCDIIYEHLRRDCEVYVKYCSNQIYQERTLNDLRRTNVDFRLVVGQLETSPVCECLNLRSFLMLPMQRVTRYPLLAAAILQRTSENSSVQASAQRAYGMAGRVVRQCNEGAKRLERIEQLVELDQTLVYREGGPKRVAFVSGSRWLIKKGAVVHLIPRRHTLGVRVGLRHRRICVFLFTDLLLITKPMDGDKRFVVKDYCQRQFVEVSPLEPSCPQVPEGSNLPSNSRLILCTLMKNHRGRQVQLVLNCESETDKTRWLEAVRPPSSQEEGAERIYEIWDCPQVRAINEYHAVQEDELDLEVGEIVNVLRKMPDGWYEGERLRDGEKGWFPSSVTEEILSDHIRAKNYRDRLRFINEACNIYMGESASLLPSSSTGTYSRRNSIIPTAAKALFRF